MQPEFMVPDFIKNNTAEEIHQRMMNNLPDDIDDMPGGFPYDFTKTAALEKSEFIQYHLVRTLMIAFPQYAWDEWLDLHGKQVHLERHAARKASGFLHITGIEGTEIRAGTIFCTPATQTGPSIEFETDKSCVIDENGMVEVEVTAIEPGIASNIKANTISMMLRPIKGILTVTNPEIIKGGTDRESNDDFYDRILAEYDNSMTYLGNDNDYIRWAKEAGAGDCIVISAYHGPGTVKLVLVDGNGQPANEKLLKDVYHYIVSPDDRTQRLLPTACAELKCVSATTVTITYRCTELLYDTITDIEQIKKDFLTLVKEVYIVAKQEGVLRYNDVRPLLNRIVGVEDFTEFLINGSMENINLQNEEYPETGILDFS